MDKDKIIKQREPLVYYKNPFWISIFLMILSLIIFLFTLNFYFMILLIIFLITSVYIKKNQCRNCKRLFYLAGTDKTLDKTIERPYHFREETRYLYSNGNYQNSKFGEPQTVTERIQVWKTNYNCRYCNKISHYKIEEINIDETHRPNPIKTIQTSIKEPKECIICGAKLRTRRKYCSKCRPSGRSTPYDF